MSSTPPAPAILFVEDDTELSAMLVRVSTAEGWRVSTVATGALGDVTRPRDRHAVVLLVVVLPQASGIDVRRRWHGAQPGLGIPIVTARGDPARRILGLKPGAGDFLRKPFEKRGRVARLRALLRRRLAGVACDSDWTETVHGHDHAFVPRRAGRAKRPGE